jgi:hypothetical protein
LRHKLAPERFREDRLIETVDQFAGGLSFAGETVDPGEGGLNAANDLGLLALAGTWDVHFFDNA